MAPTVVRAQAVRRWLVVGAVAAGLIGTPGVVAALPVRAPVLSPADLVVRIEASAGQPFQGYALSTGTAGLPALPQLSSVSDLLGGDTRLRAWYASPRRWRVDVIDTGAETDTYRLAADREVTWDYGRATLTEVDGTAPVRLPRGADLVPPDLARRLLAMAAGDRYSGLPARRIAGIAAAGVRVTPASPHTTVGHVDIWADPTTGLPLEVTVTGKGATRPILTTRFLDVALRAPDPAVLAPPPVRAGIGYTVADANDLTRTLSGDRLWPLPLPPTLAGQPRSGTTDERDGLVTYGTGLARFVVIPVPRDIGFQAETRMERGGGVRLDFPDGDGVLIATPLLTVLASDAHPVRRNYLLAGLVDATLLKQAGAELSQWGSTR